MNKMFTSATGVGLLVLACSSQVSAELHSSLNGKAYYDDVLEITWLADASYAKTSGYHSTGKMNWVDANAWANALKIDGVSGWRLPTLVDIGKDGPNFSFEGSDSGYNPLTGSAATTVYSELASMWYDTLGNQAQYDTSGNIQPSGLSNSGPFKNLKAGGYWTDKIQAWQAGYAWFLATNSGNQSTGYRVGEVGELNAWAVHPGDMRLIIDAKFNGWDTSIAPGPAIESDGGSGTWHYTVKNTSDTPIYNVRLFGIDVEPERADQWERLCYLDMIPPGGAASCIREVTITDGPHETLLSAQGTGPDRNKIVGKSTAWYTGGSDFQASLDLDVYFRIAEYSHYDDELTGMELTQVRPSQYIRVLNTGDVLLRDVRVYERSVMPSKTSWSLSCTFDAVPPGREKLCTRIIDTDTMEELDVYGNHFSAQVFYKKQKIKDDEYSYYYFNSWDDYLH